MDLIILLLFFLLVLIMLSYVYIDIFSYFRGAPFVPTSGKMVDEILEKADLKKDKIFIELGSGDGRVVMAAVKRYGVNGVGVDIHPYLIFYSRFISHFKGLKKIRFVVQNFYKTDLKEADYIFLFLLPETLSKVKEKIDKECRKGTMLIVHGFKINGMDEKIIKIIERKSFSTYYYKV